MQVKTSGRQARPAKPLVTGWRPDNHCRLAVDGESLVITNTGQDPHLSFVLPKSLAAGRFVLHVTMASRSSGRGQWFWREDGVTPAFHRDRSVTFDVDHSGKAHEYRIEFQAARPIRAVRLDPGQAVGEVRVSAMTLMVATTVSFMSGIFESNWCARR